MRNAYISFTISLNYLWIFVKKITPPPLSKRFKKNVFLGTFDEIISIVICSYFNLCKNSSKADKENMSVYWTCRSCCHGYFNSCNYNMFLHFCFTPVYFICQFAVIRRSSERRISAYTPIWDKWSPLYNQEELVHAMS